MLRYKTVLALVAVLGLGMMTADTFGQCSKSKATQVAAKNAGCCQSAFPTMKTLVGDKDYGCPMSAEKAAKASDAKIVYVVAGEKYGCRISATKALADAAEDYVKKYTTIACVVDGKVMYCDDKSSCSSDAKGKTVSAGATCSKSRTAKLVKEDGRSDDGKASTCSKSRTAKLAKAAGCCSSKSRTAKLAKAEGVSDCCKDAKNVRFLVAGRTYDKRADAVRARDVAVAAVKAVSMSYVVDGKEYKCSSQVCPSAMKAGKVKFVVNDVETKCDVTARINLAKAQYDAAKGATVKLASL